MKKNKKFLRKTMLEKPKEYRNAIIFYGAHQIPTYALAKRYGNTRPDIIMPKRATSLRQKEQSPYISPEENVIEAKRYSGNTDYISAAPIPTIDGGVGVIGYDKEVIKKAEALKMGIVLVSTNETINGLSNFLKNRGWTVTLVHVSPDPIDVTIAMTVKAAEKYDHTITIDFMRDIYKEIKERLGTESEGVKGKVDVVMKSIYFDKAAEADRDINIVIEEKRKIEERIRRQEQRMPSNFIENTSSSL